MRPEIGNRLGDGNALWETICRAVSVGVAMVTLAMASGCAGGLPNFQRGVASIEQFEADKKKCELQASSALARADQQAEQFEDGSDAGILAGGLTAMFVGNKHERSMYIECMSGLGYGND